MRSVLHQTYENIELIAIDDGSADATFEILSTFAAHDHRVHVLSLKQNQGIVAALNWGLDHSKGAFVARMDADDIADPNRLAKQLSFLDHGGLDLCGTSIIEFGLGIARTVRAPCSEGEVRASMMFQSSICHPTVMARRAVFDHYRYRDDYELAEDYDLFARASANFRIANISEPLLRYRRHREQATQAKRDAMERVLRRIRIDTLRRFGLNPTAEEQRLHNLIRAPSSIRDIADLQGIEEWLLKLYSKHDAPDEQRVIASQWIRACIRAAPLGRVMWKYFRASPLHARAKVGVAVDADLLLLAMLTMEYRSRPFEALRRFGLST